MGLISDIAGGVVKTLTSPLRFARDAFNVAKNGIAVIGSIGDKEAMQRNLAALKDSAKSALFSGGETAFLLISGGTAALAKGVGVGAAKAVGIKVASGAAASQTLKHASNWALGTAFVTGYAENKIRG